MDRPVGLSLELVDRLVFVNNLAPGGPASNCGMICLGDMLQKVHGRYLLQSNVTLETLIRSPAGSTVEL